MPSRQRRFGEELTPSICEALDQIPSQRGGDAFHFPFLLSRLGKI
jgi:hypothetical protein